MTMFHFTKQERTVLSLFVLTALFGAMLRYAFAKYPALVDIVNLIDSDRIYSKVDINTSSVEELIDIPYIGEYTANNIVRYRQEHGPFKRIEQIKNVKGIRDKNYEGFYRYLRVK
ncbi:MAG: helix-hairpin-helix domain-containing protein [Candidatus Omnitrophica bacterium]|nr:helix-hairpin-helix domain-containing protein [Candidatus Omnitrophota bacterium]